MLKRQEPAQRLLLVRCQRSVGALPKRRYDLTSRSVYVGGALLQGDALPAR